jgi:methylmalonyl-CoA/ethylmalonyl-CoA epimerase
MAFTRIHHVGLITPDLENGKTVMTKGFGLDIDAHRTPLEGGNSVAFDNVTALQFPIGEMFYEISTPNSDSGDAAEFLKNSGGRGGIHHIALATNDIASEINGLQQRGIKVKGSWDGKSAVFLDPETTLGANIQIVPEDYYHAHPYYRGNGLITGMAHVGLAARSAAEVRDLFETKLQLHEDSTMERGIDPPDPNRPARAADDPVHLLEYPIGGSVVEISIPWGDASGTAKLVASRAPLGAVYHHTCPFAPDVHAFTDYAVAGGIQQIGSIPPKEETARVVAWFHPRSCLGMLVELWNRPAGGDHYHPIT